MNNNSKALTIRNRQDRNKALVVGQLKRLPIVQVICEKIGIGRATYYRWRKEDKNFRKETDQAITEGRQLINDMAESQLLSAIKERNMTAIIFWLKHNHAAYTTRVEIAQVDKEVDKLNPKEEAQIKKALKLAGLLKEGKENDKQKNYRPTKRK